jgi:hypothetical protein
MSAVAMSTAAIQQLGDVLLCSAGASPVAVWTLRRCWNNGKCGVGERRFKYAKEYQI